MKVYDIKLTFLQRPGAIIGSRDNESSKYTGF